jgi:hypothetical protein
MHKICRSKHLGMATISDMKNMEIGALSIVSLERQSNELFQQAETADDWLRLFTFSWNQLI